VPFMSRFKLIYALFINVENETALYWLICYTVMSFKASLNQTCLKGYESNLP
jgi:hypothetical protein